MKAQAARFALAQLFDNEVDILIAPSAPGEAPLAKEGTGNPVFCRGWTLSGLPCINLNVSSGPNGLPCWRAADCRSWKRSILIECC
jgi:Asp-tRNA(Asn)/Glu-tRNA(Gln) amidotransferase A subunit family amidase